MTFVAVVLLVLRSGARTPVGPPPDRGSWRIYLISVVAMVVAIPMGSLVINRLLGQPALVLPWVVLVVGVHFLPFARAFRAPVFRALGLTMIVIALVGGLVVVLIDPRASAWTGVTAGFALLGFSAVPALDRRVH